MIQKYLEVRDYRETRGEGYNDAYGNGLEPEIPVWTHI